jgi:hypothetical protein
MIRPVDFQFNIETAADNQFMKRSELSSTDLLLFVLYEFDRAVRVLRENGLHVEVFDKSLHSSSKELSDLNLPDSVFPSNWISTDLEGNIILYPMYAKSRSAEKQQFRYILEGLLKSGFHVKNVENF